MARYVEELVSQQVQRSEIARKREEEAGQVCGTPVVTISRGMGSGARIVARKLADDLHWSLWDKEIMEAMAEDGDVSQRVLEAFDEKAVSEIELFARGALGDHEMSGFMYARRLARAVASIARLGNAIILGRGANYLLPEALNVRIDASDEVRIQNMINYESMTRQEAEKKIHASDKERQSFAVRTFGKQRVAAFKYDLRIWMDDFSPSDAAEIIKAAIKMKCKPRAQQDSA